MNDKKLKNGKNDTLNVLIVTYNDRAYNLRNVLMEPTEFVRYVISHQITKPLNQSTKNVIEDIKKREDVIYSTISSKGVAKNRNNALQYVTDGIALCSDDDVTYFPDTFINIMNSFKNNPDADIITFKILKPDGKDFKRYPSRKIRHNLKSITATGTVEMAFRVKKIKEKNLKFDEKFGPGSDIYPLGEDFIFIADSIKNNLRCYFLPIPILIHPPVSSGDKLDANTIFSRGAVFARTYGKWSYFLDFLFAVKKYPLYRRELSFFKYLILMIRGSKNYFKNIRINIF